MNNNALLYDAFNLYYSEGVKAKDKGDFGVARRKLLRAAEALYGLAKGAMGELKCAMVARADRLVSLADNMDKSGGTKLLQGRDNGGNSGSGDSGFGGGQAGQGSFGKSGQGSGSKERNSVRGEGDTSTDFQPSAIPNLKFSDVAGLDEVKEAVNTRIILPRKYPEVYKMFDKKVGGGILLYGAPGTGKSMIAKAIANEVGAVFFEVKCSDIMSKWFGEAEKNIKNLFDTARSAGRAVIFFDEFEAIGARRGGGSSVMARIIPELLAQIQGFAESDSTLLLIAATNRPYDLDTAFLRPGRFNELLYVPLPDAAARMWIIENAFKNQVLSGDVSINEMVVHTEGFNGADVVEFCERVKGGAMKRVIQLLEAGQTILDSDKVITNRDVDGAKAKVKSSVAKSDIDKLEKFKLNINKI
ncbi:MAG: ATP-binding protein [Firmicutes bacterium]|nr:ATP-binding protein [Bacillota bacterium]